MLFSGKENVFMCLVAFQKIFWKIFFGVWRRRRKRQTQMKEKTARLHRSSPPSIAISPIVAAVDRDLANRRSHSSSIDERCDHVVDCDLPRRVTIAIDEQRDRWARSLDDRTARRTIAPLVRRSHRLSIDERRDRQSMLSDLGSLFSLSLSLSLSLSFSGNDLKWKWGCKIIFGSKVKISVNRKPFSGKWNLPLLPNTWVWGKMISWNHFPPKQTHP